MATEKRLFILLLKIFSKDELVSFCMNFEECSSFLAKMNMESHDSAASSFIFAYSRVRGLDSELFARLLAERPRQRQEILAVMSESRIALTPSEAESSASAHVSAALLVG